MRHPRSSSSTASAAAIRISPPTQIERLESETGCRVRWRPLFSGDLFAARGRDPFAGAPASGQYDWAYRRRDAERWAAYYGGAVSRARWRPVRPAPPRARRHRRRPARRRGAVQPILFQALFVDGTSPLDDDACVRWRTEAGLDPGELPPCHRTARDRRGSGRDGRAASARGVFGVPSFVLGDEVYFGNDRLVLLRHALLKTRAT